MIWEVIKIENKVTLRHEAQESTITMSGFDRTVLQTLEDPVIGDRVKIVLRGVDAGTDGIVGHLSVYGGIKVVAESIRCHVLRRVYDLEDQDDARRQRCEESLIEVTAASAYGLVQGEFCSLQLRRAA